MRVLIATFGLLSMLIAGAVVAKVEVATLRGSTELTEQGKPPMMAPVVNEDVKLQRAYPMQPPIIPHKIDGYQVDLNSNKCLSCHSRKRTAESQAPMVSVTHFMDRDGNFLADVSPRRYFCQQCHVTQDKVKPLIENEFKDVDLVLKEKSAEQVK
ncbi:nitrate reductase cytochrome c-type subunit [Corallincola luteus]|uniref:Periplasmic nitrate reductase, electron transfer subunit n=2 Tax=Corallincola TaxID=1775176 RepID=A0A368NMA2_9GAMM|nr:MULTISPECIES: nitrate reductase cytochrome c-type subunit [Corallincola]RCU51687.1 nitrate reductase cytochrome c-type subunit [Corallincola holothuriorum]TCI04846.1 nitrate reductase cytochrome c-type subunit [Corallincola luteus]